MEEELSVQDFADKYECELIIPSKKPGNQFILCPVGLVGAGKTTVVKLLSEKLPLVRISGDEIRKLLKENRFGYEKVQDIATVVAEKYLNQGYSICSDNDCVTEKTQKILGGLRDKYNLRLVWIHINPPEKFIINNLKNRKPNWLGTAEQMIENYYARKPLHEYLDFPFVYTFDPSKPNLPEQIEQATQAIRKTLEV